ncbi:MAG TPA: DUF835 domain-containing protein [Thermococcaceae archaeon]|jgi:hypothetical protein|nr:DUF835 domain-containing protein [Thermococcaceae archaeon]
MVNYALLSTIQGGIVLGADILAFILILRVYLKTKRKSALLISLAWFFDILTVLSYSVVNPYAIGLFLSMVSVLMFSGIVELVKEENGNTLTVGILPFSLIGPSVVLYLIVLEELAKIGIVNMREGYLVMAGSHVVGGIFFFLAGYSIKNIIGIYGRKAKYLSIGLILFGAHLFPIPIIYGLPEHLQLVYPAIGYAISAILVVLLTALTIKLTSSEEFLRLKTMEIHEVKIAPGVRIINQEEYKKIKEKLKDAPVLAFVRTLNNIPENWTYYFVTTATKEGEVKTISPMNLERMTELSYKYLKAMEEVGSRGIILIDCLEYLVMYNEFTSVIKFLNKLKDFVVSHNGTLILVAEKDAFEEQQWTLLTRLLEDAV